MSRERGQTMDVDEYARAIGAPLDPQVEELYRRAREAESNNSPGKASHFRHEAHKLREKLRTATMSEATDELANRLRGIEATTSSLLSKREHEVLLLAADYLERLQAENAALRSRLEESVPREEVPWPDSEGWWWLDSGDGDVFVRQAFRLADGSFLVDWDRRFPARFIKAEPNPFTDTKAKE